jgi:hypothetical protein
LEFGVVSHGGIVGNVEEPTPKAFDEKGNGSGGFEPLACVHVKGFGKELSGMWTE